MAQNKFTEYVAKLTDLKPTQHKSAQAHDNEEKPTSVSKGLVKWNTENFWVRNSGNPRPLSICR